MRAIGWQGGKIARLWVLIVACWLGMPQTGHAQQADCEAAAQQQQQARSRVGAVRGLAPSAKMAQTLPLSSFAARLEQQIATGAMPKRSALLFYIKAPGGGLNICLVGPQGLIASAVADGNAANLSSAVEMLRWSYGVEELQQVRAARRTAQPAPVRPDIVAPPSKAESQLSALLLPQPIAAGLAGLEHLVIVPAGPIGAVPFPALTPSGARKALVETVSITIAPSLAEFADDRGAWAADKAFARPLVVGNPVLPPSEEWTIPPLPGAEAEAREVAGRIKGDLLVGDAAQRAAVTRQAPEASLIYVAAHGSSDSANPLDGGLLMLSGPTLEDGWWKAREIQSSHLQAELAVLSACQTGLGRLHDGGMIGLARAFQLAGTRRVVMSLWSVDDEATKLLMTRFVVHAAKAPPAEALRLAMLDTRRQYPDPALWASFLAFGTAR